MIFRFRAAPVILLLLGACSKAPDGGANVAAASAPATGNIVATAPLVPSPAAVQPPGDDPTTFAPLRSVAVKDAIHHALSTGQTQRWQDGKLSGYAVPSVTTGANGCRAVRYTVDQRPGAAYESITACDASR